MAKTRTASKINRGRRLGGEGGEVRAAMLRELPSVDECLRAADRRESIAGFARPYLKLIVQRAQAALRAEIARGASVAGLKTRAALVEEVIRRAKLAIKSDEPALKPVINATGVVLHTNLGRAILAEAAVEAVAQAATSPLNLEYDLAAGARGDRDAIVETELRALTGAEAATVVNNNAAAVLLALNSVAEGREVIVSRGELIEIGGSFRLPEVMAKSGAHLREVGTTNRTHPRDYIRAIGENTALLLKVHPSNYRLTGFTAEVGLKELVEIGRKKRIPVMEDLGSGALIDLTGYGLPHEPVVAERVAAGAGLVTFSGDKLLGGPQAGVVVGKRALIAKLKENPLKRAVRCDKLTLAALSATLRLYIRSAEVATAIPTLRLLRRSIAELEAAAARAKEILAQRLGSEFQIEVIASSAQVGSGAMPVEEIPSRALSVTHARLKPAAVAALFRAARPPIIGRVKDNAFILDLRTVEDPTSLAPSFANPA